MVSASAISLLAGMSLTLDRVELPGTAEVDSALERVFRLPEFQPPSKGWLTLASEWIQEKAGEVLDWLFSLIQQGLSVPGASEIVFVLLTVVIVFLLARLVWGVLRIENPGKMFHEARGPSTKKGLSPESHLRAAAELAAAGRFLEAERALYLGVVLWLDAVGHARYLESKTGGEYACELGRSPLVKPFQALLRAFYPVAFGGRPAERQAYDDMRLAASEMGVPT